MKTVSLNFHDVKSIFYEESVCYIQAIIYKMFMPKKHNL